MRVNIGDKFGKLTVASEEYRGEGRTWVPCTCNCGNATTVRMDKLKSGHTASCGCLLSSCDGLSKPDHPDHHLFVAYKHAQQRCSNPRNEFYDNYGGRGIRVRLTFDEFCVELGPRPTSAHTVDRIDFNGDYAKGNLRWATRTTQSRNRRSWKRVPTGYRGVYANGTKFQAAITVDRRAYYLGLHNTSEEAAHAYDRKALELLGDSTELNFPPKKPAQLAVLSLERVVNAN
jgi:hypothetical protein